MRGLLFLPAWDVSIRELVGGIFSYSFWFPSDLRQLSVTRTLNLLSIYPSPPRLSFWSAPQKNHLHRTQVQSECRISFGSDIWRLFVTQWSTGRTLWNYLPFRRAYWGRCNIRLCQGSTLVCATRWDGLLVVCSRFSCLLSSISPIWILVWPSLRRRYIVRMCWLALNSRSHVLGTGCYNRGLFYLVGRYFSGPPHTVLCKTVFLGITWRHFGSILVRRSFGRASLLRGTGTCICQYPSDQQNSS